MDLFEYQGKQFFARFGIPVSAGRRRRHRRRGGGRGRRGRLSGRGQGPGPGGRAGQGRRRQAGQRRRRGPRSTPATSSAWTSRATRQAPVDRARLRHRPGVLRQLHPRPGGQEAPRHGVGQGRGRDRGGGRGGPRGHRPAAHRPGRRASTEADARRWSSRPASTPRRRTARSTSCQLYRCYVEGDADLVEINPLILTPDGQVHALDAKVTLDDNAAFRHPEWDELRGHRGARRARAARQGEGPAVRRARRLRSASSPTAPGWP